ncbi:MAG TPA: hypothetical protein VFB72_05560 [Verrucomicrobiae bacterium]|nr:hypothetical protein [Verrucomicrobiae bacterium]
MKHRVDVLNFFLIWTTLWLALTWPFQLFLFSYIVLGPLHYLTEINWLDQQNYFLRPKDRNAFIWTMIVIVAALGICTYLPETSNWKLTQPLHDAVYNTPHENITGLVRWSYVLILVAFVMSSAWVLTERWLVRAAVMAFCLASTLLFYKMPTAAILFGILLPTIIHVFFFTICFMLYGSLKAKSFWGHINVVTMFIVLAVIAISTPGSLYGLSDRVMNLTVLSEFDKVNLGINKFLGTIGNGPLDVRSPAFLKVQAFIAFAYTYHYLNWFSKTSIIRWHRVPKKKLVFSLVVWGTSVGLFAVDYRLGFAASFALSVLHILLEFPLNYVSIQGVFSALVRRKKVAEMRPVPVPAQDVLMSGKN